MRCFVEYVVSVCYLTVRVEAVNGIYYLEFGYKRFVVYDSGAIGQAVKVLLYIHVFHKVEVDVFGYVHVHHLYEPCGIRCYIYVSVEACRFGVVRRECEVYAMLAFDVDGVHYVILVECRADV